MALGVEIIIPTNGRLTYAPIVPAVQSGCLDLYLLGGALDMSCVNHIDQVDSRNATVIGSPVVKADSLGLKSKSSYLETGRVDSLNGTSGFSWLAVARVESVPTIESQTAQVIGCQRGTEGDGWGVYISSSLVRFVLRDGSSWVGPQQSHSVAKDVTEWMALGVRYDPLSKVATLKNLTSGHSYDVTLSNGYVATPRTIRIGSSITGTNAGVCDVAYAQHWGRVLSDVEFFAEYAQLQNLLATNGISV